MTKTHRFAGSCIRFANTMSLAKVSLYVAFTQLANVSTPFKHATVHKASVRRVGARSAVLTGLQFLALTLVTSITTPVIHARACETSIRCVGARSAVLAVLQYFALPLVTSRATPIICAATCTASARLFFTTTMTSEIGRAHV